jgi:hypothetical protein
VGRNEKGKRINKTRVRKKKRINRYKKIINRGGGGRFLGCFYILR